MLKKKKAVLFDMDGTLVDSMNLWVEIDRMLGEKYHIAYPPTFHRDIEGMSFPETAAYFHERLLPQMTVEEIKTEWISLAHAAYRDRIPYKPGAKYFLQFLQKNGWKTAICTSNERSLVDAMGARLQELRTVDYVVTSGDVAAGKPAPDVYLRAADALGVSPRECLVFEDIPNGVLAGKNAGMDVCAVADAFSANLREEILALADYFITDYRQVLDGTYTKTERKQAR